MITPYMITPYMIQGVNEISLDNGIPYLLNLKIIFYNY